MINLVKIDPLWQEFIDAVNDAQSWIDDRPEWKNVPVNPIKTFLKSFYKSDRGAAALALTIAKWCRNRRPARGDIDTCGCCVHFDRACHKCPLTGGPTGKRYCVDCDNPKDHLNFYIAKYKEARDILDGGERLG